MASDNIVELTSDSFETEVTESDIPVLVDFWAPWCGPCLAVAPTIEELAEEMEGDVKFAKINVDENQEISFEYGVSSIPTFILFKDGEVAERMMGARQKGAFKDLIQRNA